MNLVLRPVHNSTVWVSCNRSGCFCGLNWVTDVFSEVSKLRWAWTLVYSILLNRWYHHSPVIPLAGAFCWAACNLADGECPHRCAGSSFCTHSKVTGTLSQTLAVSLQGPRTLASTLPSSNHQNPCSASGPPLCQCKNLLKAESQGNFGIIDKLPSLVFFYFFFQESSCVTCCSRWVDSVSSYVLFSFVVLSGRQAAVPVILFRPTRQVNSIYFHTKITILLYKIFFSTQYNWDIIDI